MRKMREDESGEVRERNRQDRVKTRQVSYGRSTVDRGIDRVFSYLCDSAPTVDTRYRP